MIRAYYNEVDPYAAQWLRNLISAGHIPDGNVDERDIRDVRSEDLKGYAQAHFFAGIGGWPRALRLAEWPDDTPVWTGSCPCQPFSSAGKGQAANDERHLWPAWLPLIAECRPPTIFGEQVEAAIGWGWIDLVFADLEAQGYACGQAVLPACGVGAPHIRQRTWWVADLQGKRCRAGRLGEAPRRPPIESAGHRHDRQLADPHAPGRGEQRSGRLLDGERAASRDDTYGCRELRGGRLADDTRLGHRQVREDGGGGGKGTRAPEERGRSTERRDGGGSWSDIEWLACTDGKARPTQPGLLPLAHGVSGRVVVRRTIRQGEPALQEEHWYSRAGGLRAFGNAIVPQVAAEFVAAYMEAK